MSGISSISTAAAQYSAASSSVSSIRQQMDPSEMADRMEEELNANLAAAGVSEEVRTAIQSDIQAAMEEQMSSGSKLDPEAMKETIDTLFDKYGLNAEEFMPQGPPPGGGPGGPGGPRGGKEATSKTDALQELLENFLNQSEEAGDSTETDDSESNTTTATTVEELSEQIMDLLFGIDEEV